MKTITIQTFNCVGSLEQIIFTLYIMEKGASLGEHAINMKKITLGRSKEIYSRKMLFNVRLSCDMYSNPIKVFHKSIYEL
jgi:hypothetical protein